MLILKKEDRMNKKIVVLSVVLILVLIIVVLIFFWKTPDKVVEKNDTNSTLANPASVFCINNNGTLEIRANSLGQYGVCIKDGKECEEWAYYRGECTL